MDLRNRRSDLNDLLRKWDPAGVAELGPDAYEFLLDPLLARLHAGADPTEISDILWTGLQHYPDLDLDHEHVDFMADELVDWWAKPRRRTWWLVGTPLVLLPVLCCVSGVAWVKWETARCESAVVDSRKTVRTDTSLIRRELAPLGGTAVEVHWILDPVVDCSFFPIPGTDPDRQFGVVQLSPDAVRSIIDRHSGWKPVSTLTVGAGLAVDDRPSLEQLSAWIPKDAKWQQSTSLDAAYVGKRTYFSAQYYVDVDHALVVFSSRADNR
ncbi:hypothetical protein SAMN05444365_103465 [Micromonospora pattaloongensis]|uniref:Uncharacterized protein n=1 Tax=Micromonospora pattaloongensis TaxID=405436 RepID=A0A1H3MQC2_9ACTN|nr:hypothetical protein [Micromonospora pattaloongensis]SDY78375.1 hypothetical protein SAMN05444365_103465 [Micromonospora pattaloongensis]